MKNICLSLAFCLIFLSCHSIENVKIVSLFYRECDITYKFYNQNGELDRILDYEKTDSCNMLIMNSAIVASSAMYACDLLAREYYDSAYIEVYYNHSWHLLEKDHTLKVIGLEDYLIGQLYELRKNDNIIVDGKELKYKPSGDNIFSIENIEGDFITLLPVTFLINEYGDANSFETIHNSTAIKFRWKNGYDVVPERLIIEW